MKILIIRFSSIGDIVLTTPVIRCLKTQLENPGIHYLTKKQYEPLLRANPYIDKIHLLERNVKSVKEELKKEKFDYVIDLHRNIRSLKVKSALDCPSFTFNKLNFEKFLMVNLKVDALPELHIVNRYFEAVAELGVKNDGKGLDYFIPIGEGFDLNDLPYSFQTGYYVWAIGAKHHTKKYPVEKVIEVLKEFDRPVVLLGGIEEDAEGDQIRNETGDHVINLCGKLTLNQSASIIKNAETVITNDTGMMHIAAAYQQEIISIWGNTIPEFGMYPYFPTEELAHQKSKILEVKNLYCRPCSKIGFKKCPEGHFRCMREITKEMVLEAITSKVNLKE